MYETTLRIDGMQCGMCEAHIQDTIRKALPKAKKVSASHGKGTAKFVTEDKPDLAQLKSAIDATGYTYVSGETQEGEAKKKHGLFGRK